MLGERRGVCQDFAHVQFGCLRSLGLPARYVSGYLLTARPPARRGSWAQTPRTPGSRSTCPRFGWIDFDPTNNRGPVDEHVTVAWGRDYADVSPVRGVILGGGEHTVEVAVDVSPENGEG